MVTKWVKPMRKEGENEYKEGGKEQRAAGDAEAGDIREDLALVAGAVVLPIGRATCSHEFCRCLWPWHRNASPLASATSPYSGSPVI